MKTTPQVPALAGMTPLGIKPNTPPPARAVLVNNEWHVIDQNGLTIATCADRGRDARLLADALSAYGPMLAALRPLAALLMAHHDGLPNERPIFAINGAMITAGDLRRAREVIAKAEGQS